MPKLSEISKQAHPKPTIGCCETCGHWESGYYDPECDCEFEAFFPHAIYTERQFDRHFAFGHRVYRWDGVIPEAT